MKFIVVSFIYIFLLTVGSFTVSGGTFSSVVAAEVSTEGFEDDEFAEFEDEGFTEKPKSDPLEGYNRMMTSFNDFFFINVYDPVARGYRAVVPKVARKSVDNFLHNILYPIRVVNNLLQGKFQNSAEETGRFLVNSTVGVFGLFDPAKNYFGLEPHEEDFGQTLGYYGVGGGPHIVLPILGPSNLRDTFGIYYADPYVDPYYFKHGRGYNIVKNTEGTYLMTIVDKVNAESLRIGEYENLKKDAIDLYPFLRDIYEQHREKVIRE